MGTLYVVATPIGNLQDLSPRAIQTLREVDVIAAEDTRRTGLLLKKFEIDTPMVSFHAFNEKAREQSMLDALAAGDVAVVSDAGTPAISDPGNHLVGIAAKSGYGVVSIPGPSSMAAAVSISGLVEGPFVFLGFLSRKRKEREHVLQRALRSEFAIVIFESAYRLQSTLSELADTISSRQAVICRELTKVHEEVIRGTVAELAAIASEVSFKGEIVLVIDSGQDQRERIDSESELRNLLDQGLSVNEAAKTVAAMTHVPKSELYELALHIQQRAGTTDAQ